MFHIEPLKLWVHKVLPVVYDDSLSYYEVLAKVTKKLNEVIDLTDEQTQYIETFTGNLTEAIQNWETGIESEWSNYKRDLNTEWQSFIASTEQYLKNWTSMQEDEIEDAIAAGITQFETYFADLTQTAVDAAAAAEAAAETAAEDAVEAVLPTLKDTFDERYAWRTAVGSPLVASTAAGMTDTDKIYVYVGSETGYVSGDWYYYDGTAWQDGGVYNSAAIVTDPTLSEAGMPADAKATGDEITDLKSAITNIEDLTPINTNGEYTWVTGGTWAGTVGNELTWTTATAYRKRVNTKPVVNLGSDTYRITVADGYRISYRAVDGNNIILSDSGWITNEVTFTADPDCTYAFAGGLVDDTEVSISDYNDNVIIWQETNISQIEPRLDDIETDINAINNLDGIDVTNTIEYTKGRVWTGAAGDTIGTSTKSSMKNRISNIALTDLGDSEYLFTVAEGFRTSYRAVDSNDIVVFDSGWVIADYRFKANPAYRYAINGGRADDSTTNVTEYNENVRLIKYTPLTALKHTVESKNNTVDFVSATANVKAVNHRGYNALAPENTIPAFKLSREMGFKYIETDVRFTSDNVPVLLHDATINRTARNADGTALESTINIADITYDEALTYDFGIWKSAIYAGTKIPTLAELMKLCRDNGLTPRVELNVLTVANAITMFNVINSYGMARKVEYNCNDITVAQKFLELEPQAKIVYGMNSYAEATVNSIAALKTNYNTIIINMQTSGISSACIEKCKETRIELETWTVNDASVIRGLDPYVSGVTSDSLNASMILYQDTL